MTYLFNFSLKCVEFLSGSALQCTILFLVGGIVNLAQGKVGALNTGFQQQEGIDRLTAASGQHIHTNLSIIRAVITY